jgi:hypothetical protein
VSRPTARLTLAVALVAAAFAGCGLGAGSALEGDGVELRVTRDFGQQRLTSERRQTIRQDQTVMRLLRAVADVDTRYGGNFVQAIDGIAGQGAGGSEDWFYFVNGIEASVGAADYELSSGDVVQWDHRDYRGAMDVRAIVGAFPEPFLHGLEGKRLPTRVECEEAESSACDSVKETLRDAGVPATGAALGAAGTQQVARVLVASWNRARELPTARVLEEGPETSGVFARFEDDGERLALLDAAGSVAREAPAGTGLVAAVRPTDAELLWIVTGLDEDGVQRAADAFRERTLRDAFAVAVEPDGVEPLPVGAGE